MSEGLTRRDLMHRAIKLALAAGCSCALSGCMRPSAPRARIPDAASLDLPKGGREALYYAALSANRVRCDLCWRHCTVAPGERGFCLARKNVDGVYYTLLYNAPSALQIDPIEKEPCFHMLPGSRIFCTGTAGCNNRCQFCHNWHLSQSTPREIPVYDLDAYELVQRAIEQGCQSVSFTYNEPTIFYEFMRDVAAHAKTQGLKALFHTNGGMALTPLRELLKIMDAVTVDLKAFTEQFYSRVCASELRPVLDTLAAIRRSDRHLEIVNLVIPELNDDPDEIKAMCSWIVAHLGKEVPIHFTRFAPAYRLQRLSSTPISTLETAAQIARAEGIDYVYIGNLPGHLLNSTFCPRCEESLIQRTHFSVHRVALQEGRCAKCGHAIPGIWFP